MAKALHINKHRYPVVISAEEVERVNELRRNFPSLGPADQAHTCPACGDETLYRTRTR